MALKLVGMDVAEAKRRWFRISPGRLIVGLLAAECLLWLSERLSWLTWHKGYPCHPRFFLQGIASGLTAH